MGTHIHVAQMAMFSDNDPHTKTASVNHLLPPAVTFEMNTLYRDIG